MLPINTHSPKADNGYFGIIHNHTIIDCNKKGKSCQTNINKKYKKIRVYERSFKNSKIRLPVMFVLYGSFYNISMTLQRLYVIFQPLFS